MAYRLKNVNYKDRSCYILLQNDNGPCPLIAAANALLLRGAVSLQPAVIRANIISTDDLVHLLADWALHRTSAQQIRSSLRQVASKDSSVESNNPDTVNEGESAGKSKSEDDPSRIQKQQQEFALSELIDILPKLQHGLDLNPKFTNGPDGCEYTNALSIFDILGIDLVHGWLSDPEWHDAETHVLLQNKTYNQLIDLIIEGNDANEEAVSFRKELSMLRQCTTQTKEKKESSNSNEISTESLSNSYAVEETKSSEEVTGEPSDQEKTSILDVGSDPETIAPLSMEAASTKGESDIQQKIDPESVDATAPLEEEKKGVSGESAISKNEEALDEGKNHNIIPDDNKIAEIEKKLFFAEKRISDGKLISTFLDETGHQLTHYGLDQLRKYIVDDTLAVFFRNNHYSTITKHGSDGHLYLLVTDLGYANADEVVWEKLDNINGDTDYVNDKFEKSPLRSVLAPTAPALNPEHVLGQAGQNERDYQLAVRLSEGKAIESAALDEEEAKLIAAATAASLNEFAPNDGASQFAGTKVQVPKKGHPMETNGTSADHGAKGTASGNASGNNSPQHNADLHLAMQLQAELMNSQPQPTVNEDASLALAHQLQAEEDARAARSRQAQSRSRQNPRSNQQQRQPNRQTAASSSKDSSCVVS